jgi:Icc protein
MPTQPLTRFRIIQLTDCHLSANRGSAYRGLDADRSLAGIVKGIRAWQPDLVLLTGDVSEDGSAASYGRMSAALNSAGSPVVALPGNHDDPDMMSRYFFAGPWQGPYFMRARGWQLVLLDSTEPGEVAGRLDHDQLARLKEGLSRSDSDHLLFALHHQPVPVGSPWIDRYPLKNPDWLFALADREPRLRCIVWGHVHQEFRQERNGVALLGSPSSVANSLPGREKFTLDTSGPACRWLELAPDGRFETGLLRAPAN